MAKKIFILSANALASSPEPLLRFEDNDIVIPDIVVDELETLARQYNTKGKNAAQFLKYLKSLRYPELTSADGVTQITGSKLRLERGYKDLPILGIENIKDTKTIIEAIKAEGLSFSQFRRLQIARGISQKTKIPVILISRNTAFIFKAKSLGLRAVDYKDETFPALEYQYKGRITANLSDESMKYFDTKGFIELKKVRKYTTFEWIPNEFVELTHVDIPNYKHIGRYTGEKIVCLKYEDYHPYGITPKNLGQQMLIEAMMTSAEEAPIVIVKGGAGTGKTYQTLACALEQTSGAGNFDTYDQIIISTSVATVGGEQIGFLPGEIENKFSPHIGGLRYNLSILINSRRKKKDSNYEDGSYYFEKGIIQMEPIGFFRGRTITNTFIIIDETQNIHPDDIKSIVSRVGEGSKIVFLGDPTQIDNPKLDERYNGLVFLSEKMKDYPHAWQVTMNDEESVRSELAKYAAKNL